MNDNNNNVFQYKLPTPDRLAYLSALSGSVRCKASHCSIDIMSRMAQHGIKPDKVAYQKVLSSLANTNTQLVERYDLTKKIWLEMDDIERRTGQIMLSENTYQTLISIFSKENQWSDVALVRERLKVIRMAKIAKSTSSSKTTSQHDGKSEQVDVTDISTVVGGTHSSQSTVVAFTPGYFKDLEKLQKVNCGKSWYRLGTITKTCPSSTDTSNAAEGEEEEECTIYDIEFGLQTHRNPIENGLSLVFYAQGEKLGFILIRNGIEDQIHQQNKKQQQQQHEQLIYSSIMGMLVEESQRGKGLANIFFGVWIQICLNTHAMPRSEKINKPLLSLVLSRFGFVPISDSAVEVEICPIAHVGKEDANLINSLTWKPQFALYSKSPKSGAYGQRELKKQRMIVTRVPPTPRGKKTTVKTEFEHPMTLNAKRGLDFEQEKDELGKLVESLALKGYTIQLNVDDALLRRTVFGYLYSNDASGGNHDVC